MKQTTIVRTTLSIAFLLLCVIMIQPLRWYNADIGAMISVTHDTEVPISKLIKPIPNTTVIRRVHEDLVFKRGPFPTVVRQVIPRGVTYLLAKNSN